MVLWASSLSAADPDFTSDDDGYRKIIVPFFRAFCIGCHGAEDAEGDFRIIEDLKNDFLDRSTKSHWGEVVNVLNSHEIPPEGEKQPRTTQVGRVVDCITQQMARAELFRRDTAIVLRRLNRDEYQNTMRDLLYVDYKPLELPQDPPAAGFDNNGRALTISPLHLELYYNAARKILDKAIVTHAKPPMLRWRFEPESGNSDSNRVVYAGQRVIVNGGIDKVENGMKVMRHFQWNRKINARDFALPHAGEYVVRIRAAGRVPNRDRVVASAKHYMELRLQDQIKKRPNDTRHHEGLRRQNAEALDHFNKDRMYDYGSPRLRVVQNLGGQPKVIQEMDVDAKIDSPKIYEFRANFTTLKCGITLEYAYDIAKVLENFWMQSGDDTWLTGADLTAVPGSDYSNTVSADQIASIMHGKQTRVPSLQLSNGSGTGSAGHSHTLSFDRSGTPLPAENSPRRLFDRLFVPDSATDRAATLRRYAETKSVLDSVLAEARGLQAKLGTNDRKKLDEYLNSVRETEQRVGRLEEWVDVPKPEVPPTDLELSMQPGSAHDRPMWIDVMMELSYLAFLTDTTRVITFEWSREVGGYGGGGENHHELSHHGGDAQMLAGLARIDRFHIERLARFIDFLKKTRDGEKRMIDNTMIMFGSGMSSGDGGGHSPKNLPLLVAGGQALGLKHGQHLAFDRDNHPPLANLLLTMIQKMGVETDKFQDATGTLDGLV